MQTNPNIPETKTATGRVSVHQRGFGFLQITSPKELVGLSAFIAPPELNRFLTDDTVSANLTTAKDGRHSASGLTLVERRRQRLFGEVIPRKGKLWLRPDKDVSNTDWPLEFEGEPPAFNSFVIATIEGPSARLYRALKPDEDRLLTQLISRHDLRSEFSQEALSQVKEMIRPHELGARRDLRALPTVTVDAPSTRDIDDAISVLPADEEGALRLFVSIADPSFFIAKGSPLDEEARARATSVYMAGTLLPMLPEDLSAAHLSLLPKQERSCMTVELRIDAEGEVTSSDVYESLICSWARLDYDEVAAFLERGEVSSAMEPVRASMPWFRAAFARLNVARRQRGGVEVAREEAKISFDPQTGSATDVKGAKPNQAHSMIERFMVAANEAIAQWLYARGVPALYRAHDAPDEESTKELAAFAHNFGVEAGFGKRLTPLSLAAFDSQITGVPWEPALRSVLLRELGPARYTASPLSHFGLAAPLYLHFTSPLRRYADLEVHRLIRRYLRGERDFNGEATRLEGLGQHINERARTASRAENERFRMLAAAVMQSRIGQKFWARVTRMKPFGMIVQLDTSLVEGMVAFETLTDGPYQLDERETTLTGPTRSFTIGTPLRVTLTAADTATGKLDFVLTQEEK